VSGTPRSADGAAATLLAGLAGEVRVEMIDEIWIFPSRLSGKQESTVIVAAAFVEGAGDRRRILTAHHIARQEEGKRRVRKVSEQQTITEQGVVPADRVERLVEGVLRRLDEELAALPPRAVRIGGEAERWEELLDEFRDTPEVAPTGAPA
jgi:hypothetical protein